MRGTVVVEGREYPLLDTFFPTVDPADPLALNEEEEELLRALQLSFLHNELLHRHVRFLYSHGSMYKCYNSNLLFHGCIPMREDGTFEELFMEGGAYSGKALMDYVDNKIQNAYFLPEHTAESADARDFMWYL